MNASVLPTLCAELLRAGQRVRFRAWGPIMTPAIRDGDVVTFAPVPPQHIRRGHVLLYLSGRGLRAHRVVGGPEGSQGVFRVRGDAPGSPEERVPADQVLRTAEALERNGRQVSLRRPFARQVSRIYQLARRALRTLPRQ